jgi:hypothetical protein
MPRYHFHSADGDRDYDRVGSDLPDEAAARLEAVRYAGEVLRWNAAELWERGQWRVEVTDDAGALLFTVITLAVDAPRPADGEPAQPAND